MSVEIVCSIAKEDIKKALERMDIIDEDWHKLDALDRIQEFAQSKEMLDAINDMRSKVKLDISAYEKSLT